MQTLAHWDGGGPGPWILLFPLIWAAVFLGSAALVRRVPGRGRPASWHVTDGGRPTGDSPVAVVGHRFASGEIDEDEYWRRLSVLDERFGTTGTDSGGRARRDWTK